MNRKRWALSSELAEAPSDVFWTCMIASQRHKAPSRRAQVVVILGQAWPVAFSFGMYGYQHSYPNASSTHRSSPPRAFPLLRKKSMTLLAAPLLPA